MTFRHPAARRSSTSPRTPRRRFCGPSRPAGTGFSAPGFPRRRRGSSDDRTAARRHAEGPRLRRAALEGDARRASRNRIPVPPGGPTARRSDRHPILWIEVFLRFGEHDPHAIIECKRIAGPDTRLCREYVVEGIDRFRTGKYAANHATGFMVGYLIAGDAAAAAQGINGYLNSRRGQHEPRPNESLAPSNLVEASWAWISRHHRIAPGTIELHHAFLFASGRV